MTKATCSTPECGKAIRARGLCSTHYNQQHQPGRHRPRVAACEVCGTEVVRSGGGGKGRRPTCSERCRYFLRWDRWPKGKALVGPMPRVDTPPEPAPTPRPRTWIAGPCAWCGAEFVAQTWAGSKSPRYCSTPCQRRASDRRHDSTRGWKYQSWIASDRRYAIYARDRWVCQLCNGSVNPSLPYNDDWAASLDHVIPRAQGGTHAAENLRLAHRWCNSVRTVAESQQLFVSA